MNTTKAIRAIMAAEPMLGVNGFGHKGKEAFWDTIPPKPDERAAMLTEAAAEHFLAALAYIRCVGTKKLLTRQFSAAVIHESACWETGHDVRKGKDDIPPGVFYAACIYAGVKMERNGSFVMTNIRRIDKLPSRKRLMRCLNEAKREFERAS